MEEHTQKRLIIGFMFAYTLIFSIYAFVGANYEFLYYSIIMLVLITYIYRKQHCLWLSNNIMKGLAILGLLHIMGGGLYLNGIRFYDLAVLGPVHYDNLVHGFGMFVTTFLTFNLVHPFITKKLYNNTLAFGVLIYLVTLGIGSVNELVEFGAVLAFDAGERVGDYYNTGWDLVSNTVGILFAMTFIPPFKHDKVGVTLKKKGGSRVQYVRKKDIL